MVNQSNMFPKLFEIIMIINFPLEVIIHNWGLMVKDASWFKLINDRLYAPDQGTKLQAAPGGLLL